MTKITIDFEVTDTHFSNIVDTACNCIGYWADEAEFEVPFYAGDSPAKLSISCEEGAELYEVTKADVEKAIALVIEGKVLICNSVRSDIESAIREDDYGNIDGYAADAIVQVACFGKLVYAFSGAFGSWLNVGPSRQENENLRPGHCR
jgi:hypothetical protein